MLTVLAMILALACLVTNAAAEERWQSIFQVADYGNRATIPHDYYQQDNNRDWSGACISLLSRDNYYAKIVWSHASDNDISRACPRVTPTSIGDDCWKTRFRFFSYTEETTGTYIDAYADNDDVKHWKTYISGGDGTQIGRCWARDNFYEHANCPWYMFQQISARIILCQTWF